MSAWKAPLAARPRLRALLRLPRRRDEPVVSGPRLRQPHDRAAGHARRTATTSRRTWPTGRSSSSATRRRSHPTSRGSCTSRPGCAHAPHHVVQGVGGPLRGPLRRGLRGDPRRASSGTRRSSGLLPADAELSPINPHGEPDATGPDGQPWPQLDFVRPWDSLTDDEQRLFARMAEVYAGFVSYTDAPDRAAARLPRGVRAAREHDHRGRLRQRRQRRGRPERLVQREQVLQQRAGHARGEPRRASTSSAARAPTTTTTPAGRGRSTPRSRTGSASPATRAASPTCCSSSWPNGHRRARRGPPPVRARGRHRARPSTRCSASSRPTCSRATPQSPIEGESFAASFTDAAARRARDAVLLDARACGRSTTRAGSRTRSTRRSRAGATSSRTSGSCTTWPRTAPRCTTSPRRAPGAARAAEGAVVVLRGRSTRACRSTTGPRSRSSRSAAAAAERAARPLRLLPRTPPRCPSRCGQHPPPLVHDRRRRGRRRRRRRGRALRAGRRGRRPRALRQGRPAALHLQLARRAAPDGHLGRRGPDRDATCSPPSSRRPATTSDDQRDGNAHPLHRHRESAAARS